MRNSSTPGPVDLRRRDFLIRFSHGAAAALIPAGLRRLGWPTLYGLDPADAAPSNGEFHLHPHYRMLRPLDALLLKTEAGRDDFVTEKYADQISAILAQWSSGLLRSSQDMSAIEKVLHPNFSGSSPLPVESRVVRVGPAMEVRHNTFTRETARGGDAFLQELRSAMSGVPKILTAEFQVTSVDAASMPSAPLYAGQLQFRIRNELVAHG